MYRDQEWPPRPDFPVGAVARYVPAFVGVVPEGHGQLVVVDGHRWDRVQERHEALVRAAPEDPGRLVPEHDLEAVDPYELVAAANVAVV